jgi:hypothetical protein
MVCPKEAKTTSKALGWGGVGGRTRVASQVPRIELFLQLQPSLMIQRSNGGSSRSLLHVQLFPNKVEWFNFYYTQESERESKL